VADCALLSLNRVLEVCYHGLSIPSLEAELLPLSLLPELVLARLVQIQGYLGPPCQLVQLLKHLQVPSILVKFDLSLELVTFGPEGTKFPVLLQAVI
jgi:hypothetical protein